MSLLAPLYNAVQGLLNRLTETRAQNLDRLSAARMEKIDTLEARLTAVRSASLDLLGEIDTNIDTVLSRMSSIRAGYIDDINAGVSTLNTRLSVARSGYLDMIPGAGRLSVDVFRMSGIWTPPANVNAVSVIVVGGGGGGAGSPGWSGTSPGGAGGWITIRPTVPVSGDVPVVVGAGGAGYTGLTRGPGGRGGQSSFGDIVAFGGEGGTGGGSSHTFNVHGVYRPATSIRTTSTYAAASGFILNSDNATVSPSFMPIFAIPGGVGGGSSAPGESVIGFGGGGQSGSGAGGGGGSYGKGGDGMRTSTPEAGTDGGGGGGGYLTVGANGGDGIVLVFY